jgi:hypothetical protein
MSNQDEGIFATADVHADETRDITSLSDPLAAVVERLVRTDRPGAGRVTARRRVAYRGW